MTVTNLPDRLLAAYRRACRDLCDQREPAGYWTGELSSSALSTATAVSALALVDRHASHAGGGRDSIAGGDLPRPLVRELIARGIAWLAVHQNDDGGWGDTDLSYSNIATTMLVQAAFSLSAGTRSLAAQPAGCCANSRSATATDTAAANIAAADTAVDTAAADHRRRLPEEYRSLLDRAACYVERQGGTEALRHRYGQDKTFAVPILTNLAIAGHVPWSEVDPLPFEWACLPQSWYRFARLPVVSYAIPALVAIGQARFFHAPPRNRLLRWLRRAAVLKSLDVLRRMQPQSGGYLEAVPLTSFVVMSLAAIGRADHTVVQAGVRFLIDSARPDGSWPIDTNLALWNTTLAISALAAGPDGLAQPVANPAKTSENIAGENPPENLLENPLENPLDSTADGRLLDWLLDGQHRQRHPFTGAAPGGWAWTDLSGGVPDVDDTSGALRALAYWRTFAEPPLRGAVGCSEDTVAEKAPLASGARIDEAAVAGVRWLIEIQNRNGGWPTFCRGWGKLPFDRSGCDLTAHALRALHAWRQIFAAERRPEHKFLARIDAAIRSGLRYLARTQRPDGSWIPLWFGNQDHPQEENPIYGTSRVLAAYADLGLAQSPQARRGLAYLDDAQNLDGGWGSAGRTARPREMADKRLENVNSGRGGSTGPACDHRPARSSRQPGMFEPTDGLPISAPPAVSHSSVEETALAVEALLLCGGRSARHHGPLARGLEWLISAVERGEHAQPSPIGFYFARLWYYERLYPLTFTAGALGRAAVALRGAAAGSRWIPVDALEPQPDPCPTA